MSGCCGQLGWVSFYTGGHVTNEDMKDFHADRSNGHLCFCGIVSGSGLVRK